MLKATGLSKSYASSKILDNIDLSLHAGNISGLLGPNGAGKSTLFKILCGLVTPTKGQVLIETDHIKPIGAIVEQPGLYMYLNAWENLKIFAQVQQAPYDKPSIEKYLLRVGLPLERKDPVRNFSMGMKQRLGIAVALLNNPKILILDEPFSGLDPIGVGALIRLLRNFAAEGLAILLSSHLLEELYKCCDYLYVIDHGSFIHQGNTAALISQFASTYTIIAPNIGNVASIQPYLKYVDGDKAIVNCPSNAISSLLKMLLDQDVNVTSCTPNMSLEHFLNAPQS